MPGFLPWIMFVRQSLLAQCFNLVVRLYYAAVQNLVYGRGNIPETTAGSSNTPPKHFVQHVQQSADMSIKVPAGLQCYPVQTAEVLRQEYVLFAAWAARQVT